MRFFKKLGFAHSDLALIALILTVLLVIRCYFPERPTDSHGEGPALTEALKEGWEPPVLPPKPEAKHEDKCHIMCGAIDGKCCSKCRQGGPDCCCKTPGWPHCNCPPDTLAR